VTWLLKYLDWILITAIGVVCVLLGIQTVRLANANARADKIAAEHQTAVAQAEKERADASERYRRLEQEKAAALSALQAKLKEEENARHAADLRAAAARSMLDDAETRYLAEQARRAAADPGSACRIDGESLAMFRELRRETDAAAGESSSEADKYAGRLNRLQDYVRDVCLSAPAAAALDDGVGLANR
jgi:hypothetical protein